MSKYTTGELAKLCGVTVRTVQYYDARKILVPSELSEGGRRLYSQADLKRLRIICFLRELGLSIDTISELFLEEDLGSVISLLIDEQETALREKLEKTQEKLDKLDRLKRGLKEAAPFSLESITDIALVMENRRNLKKVHTVMLATGIPVSLLEVGALIVWIGTGVWWPAALWLAVAAPWGVLISRYYFSRVAYICPKCHETFKPNFWAAFSAWHTPRTRKLTCTVCGHQGYCVETWGGKE